MIEVARRVGVKLLVGAIVALVIVYLPMAAFVNKAETARAMNGIDFGPTVLSGDPGASPMVWKVVFGVAGLLIAGIVYWSFDAPWRGSILVGVLVVIGGVVTVKYARGVLPHVVAFVGLVGAMGLAIWHDRWLGGYVEDEQLE